MKLILDYLDPEIKCYLLNKIQEDHETGYCLNSIEEVQQAQALLIESIVKDCGLKEWLKDYQPKYNPNKIIGLVEQ